jgi:hypothetical protein
VVVQAEGEGFVRVVVMDWELEDLLLLLLVVVCKEKVDGMGQFGAIFFSYLPFLVSFPFIWPISFLRFGNKFARSSSPFSDSIFFFWI